MTCIEKYKQEHGCEPDVKRMCPHISGGIDIDEPEDCDPRNDSVCAVCWSREAPDNEPDPTPTIKDSGSRTEFNTGAVRDIQKGKGRCDLMPLDVVGFLMDDGLCGCIEMFKKHGDTLSLKEVLDMFMCVHQWDFPTMFLEVAKHFEAGAEKYGENNWQKGIPVRCYIDSAVRHYLKWLRGDKDEPHDRAFCWNIMCAIWTCKHKPELNDYAVDVCPVCGTVIPDGSKECPNCRVSYRKD